TLLGSVVTHVFQRRNSERAEQVARAERLRQERLAAYSEFAGAVMDLRRAAYDRWHRHQENPDGSASIAARDEYYRLYAVARNLQFRLRLLADDSDLVSFADNAVECTTEIVDAGNEDERAALGERARQALETFVSAAAARLQ